ncbi:disulfide isomerase DsbC N-terminal domain-containing protein [Undibacterium arcticum]
MGINIKVDSVTKTPYGSLFEIRTNGDIFYTDEKCGIPDRRQGDRYHDLQGPDPGAGR